MMMSVDDVGARVQREKRRCVGAALCAHGGQFREATKFIG
jgi:hypothetical protein